MEARGVLIAITVCFASNAAAQCDQTFDRVLGESNVFPAGPCFEAVTTPKQEQKLPVSEACLCVHYARCAVRQVSDDGKDVIDKTRPGVCDDITLEVCCEPENVMPNSTAPDPPPSTLPKPPPTVPKPTTTVPKPPRRCGQRQEQGVIVRVKGGPEGLAQFGEFPWMVGLLQDGDSTPFCGGALVAPQVVITAGHCLNNKPEGAVKVRAGEWNLRATDEPLPHQEQRVQQMITHPNFNAKSGHNDLAILTLSNPILEEDHIGFLCLPKQDQSFDSMRCFATGWGVTDKGEADETRETVLKKQDFPIVNHTQCQTYFRATRLGQYFRLHPSLICAGGESTRDTCRGDGGSPLVCPMADDPSRYTHAGIVAWGIGCGQKNVPGAYTNVARFRDWIADELVKMNIDISDYQH